MNIRQDNQRIDYLVSTLWKYRLWWIAPAIAGLILASAYALVLRGNTWTARQSFIVRDDLLGQSFKPGRFESQESMKSAQETILEISRRPQVIRKTLEQLGPETSFSGGDWITDELIEDMQGAISFSAPNGAEFGKTEVIVLTAKAADRERARKFAQILGQEVVAKVNEVRMLRLQSMEAELIQARDGAVRDQKKAIVELKKLDALLGPDVGVMNSLNDSQAGDTPMKREILQIKTESRQLETELEIAETALRALMRVYENPELIIHLSSDVLQQQPALNRLKEQLVLKQAALSSVLGANQPEHPAAGRARLDIQIMEQQILDSIEGEISGRQATIQMRNQQLERLNGEIEKLNARLITLSSKRADHLRLTAEVRQLTESANKAQSTLSEVQAMAHAARATGLITPVDEPQVGTRPDGIGKKLIAAAGGFGGLLIGLGLVMLIAPPMDPVPTSTDHPTPGRRTPSRARPSTEVPAATPVDARSAIAIESAATAMQHAAQAMQKAASIPRTNSLSAAIRESATESQPAKSENRTEVPETANRPSNVSQSIPAPTVDDTSAQMLDQKIKQALEGTSKPVTKPAEPKPPVASKTEPAKPDSPARPIAASTSETSSAPLAGNTPVQDLRRLASTQPTNPAARPVDLAKSADDGVAFVRSKAATEPEQPDVPTISPDATIPLPRKAPEFKAPPQQPIVPNRPAVRPAGSENPFLKNRPAPVQQPGPTGSSIANSDDSLNMDSRSTEAQPPTHKKLPDQRQSAPTVVDEPISFSDLRKDSSAVPANEDATIAQESNRTSGQADDFGPVPEKIQKLTDSISQFVKKQTDQGQRPTS
ncbi:MAG: hypothetical protein AAFN77_16670 [Planctomycetota bacterium]